MMRVRKSAHERTYAYEAGCPAGAKNLRKSPTRAHAANSAGQVVSQHTRAAQR